MTTTLHRIQKTRFLIGVFFLLLSGVGAALNPRQFFISYLVAFLFWIGLSLGCLNVAMIHYLAGGRWGFVTRRFLEAGFMTLPLMAVLFIPLCFGLHELYPWTHPAAALGEKISRAQQLYRNVPAFLLRAAIYFFVWLVFAFRLRKASLRQDKNLPAAGLKTWSGPGMVIVPLTATFALIDWAMGLEPKWSSTIFPLILLIGQALAALAFVTVLLARFRDEIPFRDALAPKHFHDLGNLLLTFVMFWTYISFSQFLIIYSGNLPREIGWYLHRIAGGWKWVVGFLALFFFAAPFFVLLSRNVKKNPARLAVIAALIFIAHIAETFWVVTPTFFPGGFHLHWLDFTAWLGVGGIWLGVFAGNLKRHPLLPLNDSRARETSPEIAHAK